jgi:CheY-like chemotaxis protein
VNVGAEKDGAHRIRFVVRDTGIGFAPEIADGLFERFEQADGSITRRFGGTGLGLAISKSLVNLMGGSISATSTPGRGATFRFEIPIAAQATPPQLATVAGEPAITPAARRQQVLLAEDHVVNRLTVELILENLPIDITGVENGAEAVEAYERGDFDLVLMDMQMPVMDGLEAIRRIRSYEGATARPRTPICILSANAMADHRDAADEAGADHFITKPLNARDLITYVMRVAAAGSSEERAA